MNKPLSTSMPPVMILCGGQGTRLRDVSELIPKPMVPVGPQPIVWHIMKTYASFGINRFILCLGYKREAFVDYFLNYHAHSTDITLRLGKNPDITYHGHHGEEQWEVTLADTKVDSLTGRRVALAAKHLMPEDEHFFLTYGDGLADINIEELYAHHLAQARAMTVTAVHPSGRFGEIKVDEGLVKGFHEKPQTEGGLINGGYMVLRRDFLDKYLKEDKNLSLEDQPINSAVQAKDMTAYIHNSYWQCMDTLREYNTLNALWDSGKAPWTKYWS